MGRIHAITTFVQSVLEHIRSSAFQSLQSEGGSPRVNVMGRKATLFSILFYTSPVLAGPIDTNATFSISSTSTVDKMLQEIYEVTMLFIAPSAGPSASPAHILATSLVSTALTILLSNFTRGELHFKQFLWIGLGISVLMGMILAKNGSDFVFRYLFFGVNFAMVLSMVYHRHTGTSNERDDEFEEFADEKSGMVEWMNTSGGCQRR